MRGRARGKAIGASIYMREFLAQASQSGKELLATTIYDALLKIWKSWPGPEEQSRHFENIFFLINKKIKEAIS